MSKDDVFSGIKLSEQVSQPGLEQRLFSPPKPPPLPRESGAKNQEIGKPGKRETRKEGKKEASQEVGQEGRGEIQAFDLEEAPTRKDSFLFTEAEFEALEDLKLDFRRKYDTKVTKNDLARCAVHLLVADYKANQERSFLGKKLLGKLTRK
jgi:hypothetical protein